MRAMDAVPATVSAMSAATALAWMDAASPDDPVLDVALSHALLDAVAAGRHPGALRVFAPGPAVAFGRLDALRPGFAAACAVARELDRTPLVRSVGGHAAVFDARCLVIEHIAPAGDVAAGMQERFAEHSGRLARVLAGMGVDARVGEVAGEYCPGAHSVSAGGRLKLAGLAQRAVRGGALTSAILVVGGGAELRVAVERVYAALGLAVDPSTAGALDEVLPGATVAAVAERVRAAYAAAWELEAAAPDVSLLTAARALVPRHAANR
jgi:octanoyl-[GcvH]:protein N-octanoyltransferase